MKISFTPIWQKVSCDHSYHIHIIYIRRETRERRSLAGRLSPVIPYLSPCLKTMDMIRMIAGYLAPYRGKRNRPPYLSCIALTMRRPFTLKAYQPDSLQTKHPPHFHK